MKTKRTPKPMPKSATLNRKVSAIMTGIRRRASSPRQPVTNERLATIWPAWNDLPPDLDATERDAILTGRNLEYADYRQHFDRLTKRFKNLLPLPDVEYHETLKAAAEWWSLIINAPRNIEANRQIIKTQLRHLTFDKEYIGWTAAYRMHREFAATRPDLLHPEKCPTLFDLDFVRSRHRAYQEARTDAVELLAKLIFVPALFAEYKVRKEGQAMVPTNLPSRFPRQIYWARIAAFGVASKEGLARFMAKEFLEYTLPGQKRFLEELHNPTPACGAYKYPFLFVWLADNAPVFNMFEARWADILEAARRRFNPKAPDGYKDCPSSGDNLKESWKDLENKQWKGQTRRIVPPSTKPHTGERCRLKSNLLTPRPAFRLPQKG